MWHWITQTDAGLGARIAAGAVVFAILAIVDLHRHGRNAKRWREYLFLLLCVGAALTYGVVNDFITSSISWEYFCFGKGLWPDSVSTIPPDPFELHLAASFVGMKATWTAGLVIGVALLVANNPRENRPPLSFETLARFLLLIFAVTICAAAVSGTIGYLGGFAKLSQDFAEMVRHDEMRPRRFMAVFGIHLGGYVGGLIGTLLAVILIVKRRHRDSTAART
ncbi:MAG TPA: hypothetical protein VHD56_00210 [Tepidisphaeraceae bacterium]|nr:hypothetical protein [Tepidisphaeraceae bacterium]